MARQFNTDMHNRHDYNKDLEGAPPFTDMPNWDEDTQTQFGLYSRNVFLDGVVADQSQSAEMRKVRIREAMDVDAEGLPLIPVPKADEGREKLDDLKAMLREFLNIHFRELVFPLAHAVSNVLAEAATGSAKARAPWTHITQNPSLYFEDEMTPDGMGLRDPSHMTDGPLRSLLQYWRDRQVTNGGHSPFRFKAYMVKRDDAGDAIMARAEYSEAYIEERKKPARKHKKNKGKASKKARGKRPARAVPGRGRDDDSEDDEVDRDFGDESDDASGDENDPLLICEKPTNWALKSRTRRDKFLMAIGTGQVYFEVVHNLQNFMVSGARSHIIPRLTLNLQRGTKPVPQPLCQQGWTSWEYTERYLPPDVHSDPNGLDEILQWMDDAPYLDEEGNLPRDSAQYSAIIEQFILIAGLITREFDVVQFGWEEEEDAAQSGIPAHVVGTQIDFMDVINRIDPMLRLLCDVMRESEAQAAALPAAHTLTTGGESSRSNTVQPPSPNISSGDKGGKSQDARFTDSGATEEPTAGSSTQREHLHNEGKLAREDARQSFSARDSPGDRDQGEGSLEDADDDSKLRQLNEHLAATQRALDTMKKSKETAKAAVPAKPPPVAKKQLARVDPDNAQGIQEARASNKKDNQSGTEREELAIMKEKERLQREAEDDRAWAEGLAREAAKKERAAAHQKKVVSRALKEQEMDKQTKKKAVDHIARINLDRQALKEKAIEDKRARIALAQAGPSRPPQEAAVPGAGGQLNADSNAMVPTKRTAGQGPGEARLALLNKVRDRLGSQPPVAATIKPITQTAPPALGGMEWRTAVAGPSVARPARPQPRPRYQGASDENTAGPSSMYVHRTPSSSDKDSTKSDEDGSPSRPAPGAWTRAKAKQEKQAMLQAPTGGSVSDAIGQPRATRATTRKQDKTGKGDARPDIQDGQVKSNASPAKRVPAQARARATVRATGRARGRGRGAGGRAPALPALEEEDEEDEEKDSEEDDNPRPRKVAKRGHGQRRR